MRGYRPDTRMVLLSPGHLYYGLRRPCVPARDRERAGSRSRGPEDVEDQRECGRPVGDDGAVRCRYHPLVPSGIEPGLVAEAIRCENHPGCCWEILQRTP